MAVAYKLIWPYLIPNMEYKILNPYAGGREVFPIPENLQKILPTNELRKFPWVNYYPAFKFEGDFNELLLFSLLFAFGLLFCLTPFFFPYPKGLLRSPFLPLA
jgi:hypothetical protein